MEDMHRYTAETEALTRAIVAYARGRIASPQPLDGSATGDELTRRAGATVTPEGIGGEEALRVLSRHAEPLDVLVTDVVMPQMGGPELAEHVRRRVPGVRVLFMSGYTDPARASFDTLAPGTQFLQKPFTPGILAGKVREVIDEAARDAAEGRAAPEQGGEASADAAGRAPGTN